jgi:hypothetical protein
MGTSADKGREDQQVSWMDRVSPVGIDGYCEYLQVQPETEVIAHFKSGEPVLDGQPAATRKRVGKGSVIKLAFWPGDDSVLKLFGELSSALPSSGRGVYGAPIFIRFVPNNSLQKRACSGDRSYMSSKRNIFFASGGGFTGNGCVLEVTSPGTAV